MTRTLSIIALLLATSSACAADDDGSDDAADTGAGGEIDDDAAVARAMAYETDFTQINAMPFPSQHGLADTVNVWVSDEALAPYEAIDPDNPAVPSFPEGSMIVKEHLDAAGAKDGFLAMLKGAPGTDPAASDWWWVRVDAGGTVQDVGSVGFCISCHDQVMDFGHVFGVALDNRL